MRGGWELKVVSMCAFLAGGGCAGLVAAVCSHAAACCALRFLVFFAAMLLSRLSEMQLVDNFTLCLLERCGSKGSSSGGALCWSDYSG